MKIWDSVYLCYSIVTVECIRSYKGTPNPTSETSEIQGLGQLASMKTTKLQNLKLIIITWERLVSPEFHLFPT